MNTSSTVTIRSGQVQASAVVGSVELHGHVLTVETAERIQILDLTCAASQYVCECGVTEGMLLVSCQHTTCGLILNEFQAALVEDFKSFLGRVIERDAVWLHNDPELSDCDRHNADAHLRATLLGDHVMLQVSGGELVLGHWQRLLLFELDGPRARNLRLQLWGFNTLACS